MPLKDHITDSSKLSEEQIEEIIAGRVKFDPKGKTILFLPSTRKQTGRTKILLYLAAIKGWRFLLDSGVPPEDATPKEIERATGISGGTVRPVLRTLQDEKILDNRNSRYGIPAHNLDVVKSLINVNDPEDSPTPQRGGRTQRSKKPAKAAKWSTKASANKPTLLDGFQELMSKKWFKKGKALSELKEKLDEMTIFPAVTQLPGHLLKAYRDKRLSRQKEIRDGKKVWVYYQEEESKR